MRIAKWSVLMEAIVIYLGLSTAVGGSSGNAISSFWGCLLFFDGGLMASGANRLSPRFGGPGPMMGLIGIYALVVYYKQWIEDYFKTR